MDKIATDKSPHHALSSMLEGYDSPAILVSLEYDILATNQLYTDRFGKIDFSQQAKCFAVSHGYKVPCNEAGEDCPLAATLNSGHKERVLHIHQTPRGKEHVDVEMLPIKNDAGELLYFVELLKPVVINQLTDEQKTLVGASKAFNKMLSKVTRVSSTDAAVLLLGESGSGKELVASAIHQASPRNNQALVTLECAGLTDSLFESELFGHVKGAFTGANNNRTGLVELANGGTLFLDEIGDVPLSMQVKLLRLIETGTFRPVGSSTTKHSNFRLICATHKNIAQMVKSGEFRQDLFYRINVFPLHIPTLRERLDDLPILIPALLKRISNKKEYHLTDSALQRLKQHDFLGNIRELRNILNRAVILTDTNVIERSAIEESLSFDLEAEDHCVSSEETRYPTGFQSSTKDQWQDLKSAEKHYLQTLMEHFAGDKYKVAEVAGISVRSLYRKLEE